MEPTPTPTPTPNVDLTGLGLLIPEKKDPRNKDYPLPRKSIPRGVTTRQWYSLIFDQGGTPQCVGYTGYGLLRAGPITNRPSFTATDLYHEAQKRDEWEGENYEGSSTLGLMKALRDLGLITEYRWATDVDTIARWILTTGPVVVGTWWHYDMFMPHNKTGFVHPSGGKAGGHEWLLIGANIEKVGPNGKRGVFRANNSWGTGFGQKGRFNVTFEDMQSLLDDEGDAVTPSEIKMLKAK